MKNIGTSQKIAGNTSENDISRHRLSKSGLLMYKNRAYVPKSEELKLLILNEMHKNHIPRHPIYQKMIASLRKELFWPNLKK